MARHATHQGVLVLTSDKRPVPTPITEKPKVDLYTYLAPGSRCAFSKYAGQPALSHILPHRETPRDWCPQQIEEYAACIRGLDPDAVEGMTIPWYWEDLHQYFHPTDLWRKGASNLYKVVVRLLKENEVCMWVERWLTWDANRYRLSLWDPREDIRSVLTHDDWYNIHSPEICFPLDLHDFFCDVLKFWYGYYRDLVSGAVMATCPPENTLQLEGQGKFTLPLLPS